MNPLNWVRLGIVVYELVKKELFPSEPEVPPLPFRDVLNQNNASHVPEKNKLPKAS
jgi:hypothetical protein